MTLPTFVLASHSQDFNFSILKTVTFIRIILWLGDFLNKLTTFFKLVWTGWILKYDTTTNKQT